MNDRQLYEHPTTDPTTGYSTLEDWEAEYGYIAELQYEQDLEQYCWEHDTERSQ